MTLHPLREIHLKTSVREPCPQGTTGPTRTHFTTTDLATGKPTGFTLAFWEEGQMLVITRNGESRWVHASEARESTPPQKTEPKTAPSK